jgi:V8-like Glu-specific endopeptidase
MIRSTTLTAVLVIAAILCVGQPWALAQGNVATRFPLDDPDSALQGADHWTDERVSEAQPTPWYDEEADPEVLFLEEEPEGPPEFAPGGLPERRWSFSLPDFPEQSEDELDFEDFGTQNIGDNDYVNRNTTLWKQVPYRAIGKLLYTVSGGASAWCTASVISGNNVIVTAAHCCYDRGTQTWNRNWAFVPAMRANGTTSTQRPYGTYPSTAARVPTAWINSGGRQNDVCVINLGRNANGQTVASQVGWLARSWNQPIIQHHFAFGYPGNISSGLYKYECSAESYANCGSSLVYGMGCNMQGGSSGGPWIRAFKRFTSGSVNFVNGVVSGYDSCTGTFGASFNGARFTSNNIVPLCTAAGC